MPRLYPALELVWTDTPSEERLARIVAALEDELTAVEEHDARTRLFFASRAGRDRAKARLRGEHALSVEAVDVSDEDWAERSQASLTPVRVGRIVVAPPWAAAAAADELLVVIQPSMGFGTGHHASTRLCLLLLQAAPVAGAAVLDVGTGSGVLAIAAARLGAARVLAIDNDPDALASARENVELNDVADRVRLEQRELAAARAWGASPRAALFDLVLANLTGGSLVRHARALAAHLAAGGALVASGFGIGDEDAVRAAFADTALALQARAEEDRWVALRLTSPIPSRAR